MSRSLAVVVMLVLVAGGSSTSSPSPSRTVPAPVPAAGSPSPSVAFSPDDPPGTVACHLLAAAVRESTLMDPGVVDTIARAGQTADAPVGDAAQRLATAYAAAATAHGTDNEPDAVAAVSAAGADMSQVCDDSGLETVG
jgi:hypothetical protein